MELLALIPIGSPKVQSSVVRARSTRESTIDRQLAGDTVDSGTTTRPRQRLQATRFVVESVTFASVYVAPEMEGSQLQLIDEVGECAVGLQKKDMDVVIHQKKVDAPQRNGLCGRASAGSSFVRLPTE